MIEKRSRLFPSVFSGTQKQITLRFVIVTAFIFSLTALTGCRLFRTNDRQELLEAELRTREQELANTQAELNSVRGVQQMQANGQPLPGGNIGANSNNFTIRDISFALGTGGFDSDGMPGDEGLQVILSPKDFDGSSVKASGMLTIAAYDMSREGIKSPIGLWQISPEQLRSYWQQGIISAGYKLALQWHFPPKGQKVRVAARFQTADGKFFETDKDVTVKPMP